MKQTLAALTMAIMAAAVALAAPPDRWLHVKVESKGKGEKSERVRINVPLDLAEKVLSAVQARELRNGKVRISHAEVNGVDLRAVLDAVRAAKDNEYVTVESDHDNVRVAKADGKLMIKVRESGGPQEQADISIPFPVIDALLSAGKDELDLAAGIRALSAVGDTLLIAVNDEHDHVRIWVDSRNTSE